jgi:hypothetical protein
MQECPICFSKKQGIFTSSCGHTFCGKCFLRLHVDASLELSRTQDPRQKSKCPFCRQVLGYEEEDYKKLTNALKIQGDILADLRKTTKQLRTTNRWLRCMRRLKDKLRITMRL